MESASSGKALFIRHKIGSTPEILNTLIERGLIAIHFEDKKSTDPDDYKTPAARKALRRLWNYCKLGAIVGADFTSADGDTMLVGRIKPRSQVKPESFDKYIYKTVQLHDVKRISLRKCQLLSALRPRQTTIIGWPSARMYLEALMHGRDIPFEVNSLDPNRLEVLCYEYLRREGLLAALLMPIGRTMQDVDIFGINTDGKKVIVQVTHNRNQDEIQDKLERLRKYTSLGALLFFFGPRSRMIDDGDIRYIANEEVFNSLTADRNSVYYKMVRNMLDLAKCHKH
jgi:hypothetical protein